MSEARNLPEVLAKWNVDGTTNATKLVGLTEVFEKVVADYKEDKKDTSETKDLLQKWQSRPRTQEALSLVDIVTSVVNSTVDNDPADLAGLVEVLSELTKHVRSIMADYLHEIANPQVTSTPAVTKDEMSVMSNGIKALFNVCQMMEELPEDYPTKVQTDGRLAPNISRVQIGAATTKKQESYRKYRIDLYFDGSTNPVNPVKLKVQYGQEFSFANIMEKANEVTDGKAMREDWSVTINGHNIMGKIVKLAD